MKIIEKGMASKIKNLIIRSGDSIKGAIKGKDWNYFVAKRPETTLEKLDRLKKNQLFKDPAVGSELWFGQLYHNIDFPKNRYEITDLKLTSIFTEDLPSSKSLRSLFSKDGIDEKTSHLLFLISTSETSGIRLKYLEDFLGHMISYPETKLHAVEKGAIVLLNDLLSTSNDMSTTHVIRQALATLGFVEPPRSSGVRILSIDGGGMRGITVLHMLDKLEELSGKKILDLFDYVCGVSTGAIIICCLMPPLSMTIKEVICLYKNLSEEVFSQNALRGTSGLLWNHAYYDTAVWEKLLKSYVGQSKMLDSVKNGNCPKIATVSTIVNQTIVTPYIFRNYAYPSNRESKYLGGYAHTQFEAIRASAAAPTVFEEFRIGDLIHQDGGLLVNNPSALALHEVKQIWPNEPLSCLVSCGTGKLSARLTLLSDLEAKQTSSSWTTILNKVVESATDTEAVHITLNDFLQDELYFRLNPHLSRKVAMDEVKKSTISSLVKDTEAYYLKNTEKFERIVKILLRPRSKVKKCLDYLSHKIRMMI